MKWETFGEESIPHYQVASWLLRLTVISVGCIAVDAPNLMHEYIIMYNHIVTKRISARQSGSNFVCSLL